MKHLFIDDHEVESIHNLARKLHQPEKFHANAVVRPEYRWENQMIRMGGSVAWDPEDRLFKLIYLGTAAAPVSTVGSAAALKLHPAGDAGAAKSFSCYATSTDGVNWEKPFLGLHDYEELTWDGKRIGTGNNILPSINGTLRGPIYHAAESDPGRRFKGLSYRSGGLYTLVSADGMHWRELDLPPQPSADVSELYLDETRDLFISTVKHRGPYGRSFYLSTSEDFQSWSEQELIFHADQTDQENGFARLRKFFDDPAYLTPVYNRPEEWRTDIYHFPVFRYEDLYLAMPVMHHWAGKRPPLYENVDSRKSVELASSRDLRHWERVAERAPFLELSPVGDRSRYDTGQIGITNGVVRRNGQLWFYYAGLRHRALSIADQLCQGYLDSSAVCMARLRMDGFASLKGGSEWGSVLTRPVAIDGRELHLNVDSWRGQVKVEVLDPEEHRPLEGYGAEESIPATVDSIDAVARWKGKPDLAELAGRTVCLRFSILCGELYAFWFGDG